MPPSSTPITAHDIRRISVESLTDPRTIGRYLRGEHVRGMSETRIRAAIAKLGITIPDPAAPAESTTEAPADP